MERRILDSTSTRISVPATIRGGLRLDLQAAGRLTCDADGNNQRVILEKDSVKPRKGKKPGEMEGQLEADGVVYTFAWTRARFQGEKVAPTTLKRAKVIRAKKVSHG